MAVEIHQVPESDPWLTLADAANEAHTCVATLRRRIRQGRLKAATIGDGDRKVYRVRRSALNKWLESTTTLVEMQR